MQIWIFKIWQQNTFDSIYFFPVTISLFFFFCLQARAFSELQEERWFPSGLTMYMQSFTLLVIEKRQ